MILDYFNAPPIRNEYQERCVADDKNTNRCKGAKTFKKKKRSSKIAKKSRQRNKGR